MSVRSYISRIFLWSSGCVLIFSIMGFLQTGDRWVAPPTADNVKNPVAVTPESLATGKALFTKNCVSCHGIKGKGDGPKSADLEKEPGNFTSLVFKQQSDGAIYWKTTEGRKPMPSFKTSLTADERWQIINYVRTLK
jgi:mono/diheme cytochrome c family protein